MSDPVPYSGTGEFPEVPEESPGERPAFENMPWFPESLCPKLTVDMDVVPDARAVPSFPEPLQKPWEAVQTCEPPALAVDCVPFQPLSATAIMLNGRRYFGNNTMDKAWCTVANMTVMDLNTSAQWRVEWDDKAIDFDEQYAAHSGYVFRVYGGYVKRYGAGTGAATTHWPTGNTGHSGSARLAMIATPPSLPSATTLSGFWNSLPKTPGSLAKSAHPAFVSGNYSRYGRTLAVDDGEVADVDYKVYSVATLPAYIYFKNTATGGLMSIKAAGDNDINVSTNLGSVQSAFDNYDCTLIGVITASGQIIQQHQSDIISLDFVEPEAGYSTPFYVVELNNIDSTITIGYPEISIPNAVYPPYAAGDDDPVPTLEAALSAGVLWAKIDTTNSYEVTAIEVKASVSTEDLDQGRYFFKPLYLIRGSAGAFYIARDLRATMLPMMPTM
jgi:hypothetical protein